jgi:hypothetical protein
MVSVGSSWVVHKDFRAHTKRLAAAYFGQKNVDLLMATTAFAPSVRYYQKYSASSMPQTSFSRVLFRVIDEAGFTRSALKKKGVPRVLALPAGPALSFVLGAVNMVRSRRPGRRQRGIEPEAIGLDRVGEEFDELWQRKASEEDRLWAYRKAEDIRWHFKFSAGSNSVTIIGCRRGGRLEGYLVLKREDAPEIGLKRSKIVDLFVAGNDPEVIDALLAAAYESAKEWGSHVLELVGLPPEIRAMARRYHPFTRRYPNFPFYYKAGSPELESALQKEDSWYPTNYDGDSSL